MACIPLALLPGACVRQQPGGIVPAAPAHALHNVHALNERIITGASPDSPGAFDALAALGVRTIISVDGAAPDAPAAAARGIRYMHLPITYATITAAQRLELARAVRDLPGPVYIHCHHGKHRGPAAAAAIAVTLGMLTPSRAEAFMHTAGTDTAYSGLFACVRSARPASAADLDAAPSDFPAVRRPQGLVAAMVEIDLATEHLASIREAGWTVPASNPDLVPAAEAARLADHLRTGAQDPRAAALGPEFLRLLNDSAERAGSLEQALLTHATPAQLSLLFADLRASCKGCHAGYRDGLR